MDEPLRDDQLDDFVRHARQAGHQRSPALVISLLADRIELLVAEVRRLRAEIARNADDA